ncbi:MAG: exported protein of unknown function [Candidatus Saccharibacteria bacterium]|nr:exported protein of unknown function [Candidatus Saccharibacteria bacterium]MDB5180251.1 exported protein of unknown function [Candidatus Saccharibacteria bacterium]
MAKGNLAIGAVIGAIAGFVSGVLLAPKSGKETRQEIKDGANKAKDVTVEKAEELKGKATKIANDVSDKAKDVAGDVEAKARELKGRAERAVESAQKGFNDKPKTANTTKNSKK